MSSLDDTIALKQSFAISNPMRETDRFLATLFQSGRPIPARICLAQYMIGEGLVLRQGNGLALTHKVRRHPMTWPLLTAGYRVTVD